MTWSTSAMLLISFALLAAVSPCRGASGSENQARLTRTDVAAGTIFREIDRLLTLQDRAAYGDIGATASQKDLLMMIGGALQSLPSEAASGMVSHIVAYVLSGGDPEAAERASKAAGIPAREKWLLEGSAAFMQGEREASVRVLARIDPLTLPRRISGRIALAQALLEGSDQQQQHFSVAISAMPGTLIEESALRRSAMAYAVARDEARMWTRLSRYARRFPRSLYAEDFWDEIIKEIVAWSSTSRPPRLDTLDSVISRLSMNQRRRVYLVLARNAAASSLPALTDFAGRRLERLADDSGPDGQLGMFYVALFAVVSADGDDALERLRSVDAARLLPTENALLMAALAIGSQIEQPASAHASGSTAADDPKSVIEERGTNLLKETRQLLSERE